MQEVLKVKHWRNWQASVGVSYRHQDAVMLIIGGQFKGFRLGYSYDITTSILRKYSSGSHELTLGYTLPKKKEKPEESGE